MKAARLHATGTAPSFGVDTVADPAAAAGEVVVELRAAAFNRRDWWIWTGDPAEIDHLPVTLGSDGAGTIVSGSAGSLAPGDEVVINACLGWGDGEEEPGPGFEILGDPREGTFAERVAVPADNVFPKPARLSWEEAAALNLAGLTAWRAAVTCARCGPGTTLLVTGAGGGVSSFAIQIAAARGARVFVTSGTNDKVEQARSLGAVDGVSYRDPEWPAQLRELAGGGIDAAVDGFGGASWAGALAALRDGGVLVSYGDTGGATAPVEAAEVYWHWRRIQGTTMGSPRDFAALLDHVNEADWRPVIDSVYPLERVEEAAARLEAPERFGKVVLTIPGG